LCDTERQGRGLVIATVQAPDGVPLKIFATHMVHTSPPDRLKELKEIVRYFGPNERCVVIGDLNSLSPHDNVRLDQVPKNERSRFTVDGKISTQVIEGLEAAGLVDAFRLKHPTPSIAADQTVGTKISTDPAHAKAPLRLDYILVSKNLVDAVDSVEVIHNEQTNKASDHFPLVMDLKF
jgi:exodeoxyribonuclease-3